MEVPSLRRFLRKRLQNIGVPLNSARALSDNLAYQYTHQGEVRAVAYIKRCGDTLLNYLYGTPAKAPWVRTINRFPVFFLAVKDLSEEILLRVAKLARAIRFGSIDAKYQQQVDKMVLPVVTPYGGTSQALIRMSGLIRTGISVSGIGNLPLKEWMDFKPPLVTQSFKKVQSVGHQTRNVAEPPYWDSIQLLADHPDFRIAGFETVFYPVVPADVRKDIARAERPFESRIPYVGEIHASQEGGGKLRGFASPYTVFQCILYPLHYMISDIRAHVETDLGDDPQDGTDCTHNQAAGAVFAQSKLRAGVTVHSVDLSNATCRFPLFPQIEMLRALRIPEDCIALLEYVCRGLWRCGADTSVAFATPSLHWQVGQPLGIAPSMSMFSLSHNLLLWGLCAELALDPTDTFRVLGDDVVICNDELHRAYLRILDEADIPVSHAKSHSSTAFAEFAGYSITRDLMVRPGQWRPATPRNMLSLAEEFSKPLHGEVSAYYEKMQKAYLFKKGLYDPPPEEWSMFIKCATLLNVLYIETACAYTAPLWYEKIREVCDKQSKRILAYHFEDLHFHREVYKFLYDVADNVCAPIMGDDSCRTVAYQMWARGIGFPFPNSMTIIDAHATLQMFWYMGGLSEEQYYTISEKLREVTRSLLYMPPKASRENELAHLSKSLGKVFKLAAQQPVEGEKYTFQDPQRRMDLGYIQYVPSHIPKV